VNQRVLHLAGTAQAIVDAYADLDTEAAMNTRLPQVEIDQQRSAPRIGGDRNGEIDRREGFTRVGGGTHDCE